MIKTDQIIVTGDGKTLFVRSEVIATASQMPPLQIATATLSAEAQAAVAMLLVETAPIARDAYNAALVDASKLPEAFAQLTVAKQQAAQAAAASAKAEADKQAAEAAKAAALDARDEAQAAEVACNVSIATKREEEAQLLAKIEAHRATLEALGVAVDEALKS